MAIWRTSRCLCLLMALPALLGLLARGVPPVPGMGAPAASPAVDLAVIAALGGTLCHDGGTAPDTPDAPAPRHDGACLLCPVCGPAGTPGVLPAAAPILPPTAIARPMQWAVAPPPRAPPSVPMLAAPPRGPPALI